NRLIAEIQREFEAKGWWFVAFARLNPIFPTGPLNYILGLTSISGLVYAWVTFVFLLPPSMAIAYVGEQLGTFVIGGAVPSALNTMLVISGAVTLLALLIFGARLFMHLRFDSGEPSARTTGNPPGE